jgi:hypothetical protein
MAPLLPGASQCPCSHEWLPQLRLLAPAPRCLSEGEAPLQVESSPLAFCLLSSSHGHNQRKRVKKNPMGLVAQAARASTLLPLSKRCGARGDANFAGCPRFDRQCGRGGVRLRRAHHASEGHDAGVHRVFGPSPRRNPLACASVRSACGLPRRCGCLISRVWVRCACASAAPARPKRQKGGG